MSTTNVSIPVFIKKGLKANLNKTQLVDGVLYFTTDTSELFFDDNQEGRFQITDTDAIQFLKQGEISFGKQDDVMHLYGAPLDSINEEYSSVYVGLRNGDTIKYYGSWQLLNPLPEWDRITRPCACIISNGFQRTLDLWEKVPTVEDDGSAVHGYGANGETLTVQYSNYGSEGWGDFDTLTYTTMNRIAPFWTNTDLYFTDGKLYLAKSDPIPVGEIVDYIGDIPIYELKEEK